MCYQQVTLDVAMQHELTVHKLHCSTDLNPHLPCLLEWYRPRGVIHKIVQAVAAQVHANQYLQPSMHHTLTRHYPRSTHEWRRDCETVGPHNILVNHHRRDLQFTAHEPDLKCGNLFALDLFEGALSPRKEAFKYADCVFGPGERPKF